MKKRYLFLIIFILTGIVMYVTNPKPEQHRKAVYHEIDGILKEQKEQLMQSNANLSKMLGNVNDESIQSMVLPFLEQAVVVEDYKVFSLTKIDLGTGSYTVGLGVFGKVFIAPQLKEKVKENISKYL
ncbi:MAG: hypothetical protein BGO31_07115 [Bacteroidetes bacterium 43-16]|nr:MAG: hypothetical protein BGO31_07115 [Bacteroidetes bacterium 43-16]